MHRKNIVLLDGGMGQELIRRSGREPTPMWSAQVMLDQPNIVRELHIDFIKAGARVITLHTYSITPERLLRDGQPELFEKLQQSAIHVAQEAREQAGVEGVKIAGCLPPLVASYRPEVAPDFDASLDTYRKIVSLQADHVDCFLGETMASVKEARACALAAKESGKPVWIGLTVADDTSLNIRSGEPLVDAIDALGEINIDAILLNCSKPESININWNTMMQYAGHTGAYANGFTAIDKLVPGGTVDSLVARADLDPKQYATAAMRWVEQGASIIGGCCEVGPDHIAEIAKQLENSGLVVQGELPH